MRREPLHPGAQRTLSHSTEYRYCGFYTDQEGNPVDFDVTMRAHAHVENHIDRLKDSGLLRFPFADFDANANWISIVMLSADLVRWFQLLCMDGSWKSARGKALRWVFFHAPDASSTAPVKLSCVSWKGGPNAEALLGAYERIVLIT